MLKFRRVGAAKALLAVLIFVMAAFILLSFSKEKFDARALLFMALTMLLIMVQHMLLCFILPNGDRLTGVLVGFLMGIGLVMQYRLDADTALRQLIFSCFGLAAMVIMLMLMKKPIVLMYLRIPAAIISLGILSALMFVGKESGGAVNWISIGGILFQPSEFVKIIFVFGIASCFAKAKNFKDIVITTVIAIAHVIVLVISKDLGGAIILTVVYICVMYVATCKFLYLLCGTLALGAGSVIGYKLFAHVRIRVNAFLRPFDTINDAGYQIAQSLFAIGTGGFFGMGVGMGMPQSIPVVAADFIYSAISEEFGSLFGICLILICLSCFIMFMNIAIKFNNMFYKYVAVGLAVLYGFQVFLTIGGVTKFIPLTGVTLPLVSYGGTSVLVTIVMFSIIQGLYIGREH